MGPRRIDTIWLAALGYFAAYVPYSALTKLLSADRSGLELLPVTAIATTLTMLVVISALGWWKHAGWPTRWTILSGLCTAFIIGTTTLAYTFEGVSIVLAMVLMRGGVLIIAPIVDRISRRKVRWFSWAGLALALAALMVGLADTAGYAIPLWCGIDIAVYLASYFVRLRFMSKVAKSDDPAINKGYLVEEQVVGGPALIAMLALAAIFGGDYGAPLREGFTIGGQDLMLLIITGALSYGTGIFGALIFLDRRENTFCVPVNRSSSIMAGVCASFALFLLADAPAPRVSQLISAGIIVAAVGFLTLPVFLEKRRAAAGKVASLAPPAQTEHPADAGC